MRSFAKIVTFLNSIIQSMLLKVMKPLRLCYAKV